MPLVAPVMMQEKPSKSFMAVNSSIAVYFVVGFATNMVVQVKR